MPSSPANDHRIPWPVLAIGRSPAGRYPVCVLPVPRAIIVPASSALALRCLILAMTAIDRTFWTDVLTFTADLAQRTGQQLLKDFAGDRATTEKDDGTLLTQSDTWADATLRQAIADRFPDHGLLSEEGNHDLPDRDWCWIIDPIDGTTNFSHGIPVWGISIGLLYRGWPVFGYLYYPPTQEACYGFWPGETGLDLEPGAFRNGRPIRTTSADPGPNQTFSFCTRSIERAPRPFCCKIRAIGSASYNLLTVATGSMVGAYELTPKAWDIAAVWPILQAAGATWISLEAYPPFPLTPGNSYGKRSNACLVVARADLGDFFRRAIGI